MDLRAQIPSSLPLSQLPAALVTDGFVAEEKIDGHRLVVVCLDEQVDARNRNAQPYKAGPLPAELRRALCAVPGPVVLDGELTGDQFRVFDLRADRGGDQSAAPWQHRRLRLERLATDAGWDVDAAPVSLVPVARTPIERLELAAAVLARGGEGVVLKRVDGSYRPGRSGDWRKAKYSRTIDAVVLGPGRPGQALVGLHADDGSLVPVGSASCFGMLPQVGSVVELRCRLGSAGRLREAVVTHRRDDKAPGACALEQLALPSQVAQVR